MLGRAKVEQITVTAWWIGRVTNWARVSTPSTAGPSTIEEYHWVCPDNG